MRRPRVAITSRLDPRNAGGVEAVATELCRRIACLRPDWDVRLTPAFGSPRGLNRLPLFGDIIASFRFLSAARHADAVILEGTEYSFPVTVARNVARKTIAVWHGTRAYETPAAAGSVTAVHRFYIAIENAIQRLAFGCRVGVAISPNVVDQVASIYRKSATLTVIPNGMPAIKPEDYPIEPHSEFRVVWSGTTTRLKGLDIAIAGCRKAREAIPSLRLHVVGLCSKESQSEEWVRFYGLVDREVARGIVANADVFLTTSRYDSFPIAILEAFALGVPVIGSPPSAWLVRGIGTAVDDLDPASYALALENVFKMPPARESLLLQANTLRQRFDWDAIARSYCEQIAAIVSSNASAGAQPKGKRGQYA